MTKELTMNHVAPAIRHFYRQTHGELKAVHYYYYYYKNSYDGIRDRMWWNREPFGAQLLRLSG